MAIRGIDDRPLFREKNSVPLSKETLVTKVRLAGNLFRIGASKVTSDTTIPTLGRWFSNSYIRYIRTLKKTKKLLAQ